MSPGAAPIRNRAAFQAGTALRAVEVSEIEAITLDP